MAETRRTRVAATYPGSRDESQTDAGSASAARASVLMVGQRSLITQRRGRFVAGFSAHPAAVLQLLGYQAEGYTSRLIDLTKQFAGR